MRVCYTDTILKKGGWGIVSYKKTGIRAVRLFNKICGEQIGDQKGGEQIIVVINITI